VGDRPIDDAFVKDHSKYKSIWDFSQALVKGEARLAEVRDLRPVIRLPPPRRGFRHIKRGYHDGGDLGYRGKEINELLLRMGGEACDPGQCSNQRGPDRGGNRQAIRLWPGSGLDADRGGESLRYRPHEGRGRRRGSRPPRGGREVSDAP